jgi:hypothetical protein
VSAASRETLISGFAALAGVLNLPERNEADQEQGRCCRPALAGYHRTNLAADSGQR